MTISDMEDYCEIGWPSRACLRLKHGMTTKETSVDKTFFNKTRVTIIICQKIYALSSCHGGKWITLYIFSTVREWLPLLYLWRGIWNLKPICDRIFVWCRGNVLKLICTIHFISFIQTNLHVGKKVEIRRHYQDRKRKKKKKKSENIDIQI